MLRRRILALVLGLVLLVVASAVLYTVGMERLEGQDRSFWQALEWAGETISTTGYGADHGWRHPAMVVFVVLLQFVGVFLVFLIFPIYLIPFLEERFEARIPKEATGLSDHVVVFRYGPAVASLLEQARGAGLATLVVEEEEADARRVMERGENLLLGRIDDDVLERAGVGRCRALVANGSDDQNAAVALTARQLGFAGDILTLVEEPFHRRALMLAGATMAYTPRHILAAALAARASERISPRLSGLQQLGRRLQVRELRIEPGSPLVGKTLAEAGIGARTGAIVIGQWVGGHLEAGPSPSLRLRARGILVVVGSGESLEKLLREVAGASPLRRQGPFLVGGFGEVGRKVVELLREVGEEAVVIDRAEAEGVDVVGNVLDPNVLEQARVREAQAVILAPDLDSVTLFATVIIRDLAPEVPVIARVNEAENVERIHAAGATFALSISQVSGQMLARRLLGEEAISIDPQLKLMRVSGHGLAGSHPAELGIRERTGCSVVAVERGDAVVVDFPREFRFEENDSVYVCGDREATRAFSEAYPQS